MNLNFTYREFLVLIFCLIFRLSADAQVSIPANGNFHLEHPDIYFSDDVPTFTNKTFYSLPNGSGPIANFPALGVRNQGDGSRYSDRTAWYSWSGNEYITGTFSFVPQYDQENNPITVNSFVTFCGRRPNSSTMCLYNNYKFNSFLIVVEVPQFLNTDAIKTLCNTQAPIQIADYFKSTITGVTFKIDGTITNTIDPGTLSLGEHIVSAEKFYNNGNYKGEFRITITERPVAVITPNGSTSICEGSNIVLSAPVSPTGQSYTYQWSTGQTSKDISVNSSGNYTVTVSNGACSSTSPSISISTRPVPSNYVNVTGNANMCDGETTILTASNAKSFLWYKNGSSTGITTQSIYITTAGSYNCVLIGDNGCSVATNPTVITVKPNPKPTIAVTGPLTICEGESVVLTGQSSGTPSQYQWSNGQSGQTIRVTTSGIYSVTATNPGSCQSTSEAVIVNVIPNQKPTITPVGSTSICAGEGIKLISSPGSSYLWSNGATTQEIFVTTPGSISVDVINQNGCKSTSDPLSISVKQKPNASISADRSTTLCAGEVVKLTASGGDSYLWYPNGESTQTINVTQAGTYYATVFKDGCSNNTPIRVVTVNIPIPPAITVLTGTTNPCFGEIVILESTPGSTYTWSTGETSKSIQVTQGGTYFVTTRDVNGCLVTSPSVSIIYKAQFNPTITAGGSTTICDGDGVLLTATNGKSYLWSNGALSQSITTFSGGAYTCKVTNGDNCVAETPPVLVTVNQRPRPSIVALSSAQFCQGGSVTLTVSNPVSGGNYTWSNGQNGQSITVTTGGIYTVTGLYQNGCSAVSNGQIVTVLPIAKPTISASGDLAFCEGGSVRLTINETGDKYLWSTGETTKSILVSTTGSYTATITNNNGCSLRSEIVKVSVSPAPVPVVQANNPLTFCQGNSVILSVTNPEPGASYTWSNGLTGPSLEVKNSGSYTVTANYVNGCSKISVATVIEVLPIVTPTITASSALTFCDGQSINLTINESGDQYTWSDGATGKTRVVTRSGSYIGTITNKNGCSLSSSAVNVVVNPNVKPIIVLSGSATFCAGETIQMSVPETPGYTYKWSTGETTSQITVSRAGNYFVTAITDKGCINTSDTTPVIVLPNPKPSISTKVVVKQ